jgi:hypothetical protein
MSHMSINAAWNETAAFLRSDGRLVFPVAFLLTALPGAVLSALLPTPTSAAPAVPEVSPALWILFLPMIAVTIVGTLAIAYLALRPGVSVGEAIRRGGRRLGTMLLASLLLGLALFLLSVPLIGLAAVAGAGPGIVVLAVLLLVAAGIYITARLLLLYPVVAVEDKGPVQSLRRSWDLTAPVAWKLVGFLLLAFVLLLVVTMLVAAIGGLLGLVLFGQGAIANFINLLFSAILQTAIISLFIPLTARLYAQATGDQVAKVFS